MTLQYIRPVMIGNSSPATTASIVSSRRLRPAAPSPRWSRAALRVTGRRRKVSVSKRLSDVEGLACSCMRCIGLSLTQLLLGDSNRQVAALDAVVALDEPLASRRPGVRPAALSA
jgi:hypothetical protein